MAKRIDVDLTRQTVTAYLDSAVAYRFDCITGDSSHPTDRGTFRVLRKDKRHISHKYHVPMYYALFFTNDGKAIHQFHAPPGSFQVVRALKQNVSGWFGSHGCVRLAESDASALFDWTPLHTTIRVF
jgi:lipoprotein-anchoring transpeptidase ErfK/SrfK